MVVLGRVEAGSVSTSAVFLVANWVFGRQSGGWHSCEGRGPVKSLKLNKVQVSTSSLRAAITALDMAIATNTKMKEHLEAVLALQEKGATNIKDARAVGRAPRLANRRTLREAILDVLAKSKKPLRPVELKDKVLQSGYATNATPQSFYIAVFNTAGKEPGVIKTQEGYRLRKNSRGRSKTGKRARKK